MFNILVINPGSTSTKIALYEADLKQWEETIAYSSQDLSGYDSINEQLNRRFTDVQKLLEKKSFSTNTINALAARGGPYRPMPGGTYRIDKTLIEDIRSGNVMADHASNLAALIAWRLSGEGELPAFFTDPVCVDEFDPLARYSGMPELERRSLGHALSIKAAVRRAAVELEIPFECSAFVVAHLGGGISIAAVRNGRIVDVNNANEEGPFSPERCGTLPAGALAKLCYSGGMDYPVMKKKIVGQGGLIAYLGTSDLEDIEIRISRGEIWAEEIIRAMAYQIAKSIGAYAAVLGQTPDAILLTGGLAHSKRLMQWITERIAFLGHCLIYPGSLEMEALALAALRILRQEEDVSAYRS